MKKILLLLVLCGAINVMSQKQVCDTPEEEQALSLNSITKCSIEPSSSKKGKKTRQITVKVSASKRRFLKKREARKMTSVSGSSLSTSGVSEVATAPQISNSLSLKKKTATSNIAALTNSLSEEEVRKASRFSNVDKIPLFTKCKKAKRGERLDCFNTEMMLHIQKHFKYPSEAVRDVIEGEVWVRFIIDKNGDVKNIKTLGPENAEILNEEATRVVSKLARFIPGKKEGERVSVKYGFPINFSLEE